MFADVSRLGLLLYSLLALAACGSGARQSVFPPSLSIQGLRSGSDGHWELTLRIQNNSYAPLNYTSLDGTLAFKGQIPMRIAARFGLDLPPLSGDVVHLTVWPTPPMRQVFAHLNGSDSGVDYRLGGEITAQTESTPPSTRNFHFDDAGWLSPVPGLPDTYR